MRLRHFAAHSIGNGRRTLGKPVLHDLKLRAHEVGLAERHEAGFDGGLHALPDGFSNEHFACFFKLKEREGGAV